MLEILNNCLLTSTTRKISTNEHDEHGSIGGASAEYLGSLSIRHENNRDGEQKNEKCNKAQRHALGR